MKREHRFTLVRSQNENNLSLHLMVSKNDLFIISKNSGVLFSIPNPIGINVFSKNDLPTQILVFLRIIYLSLWFVVQIVTTTNFAK